MTFDIFSHAAICFLGVLFGFFFCTFFRKKRKQTKVSKAKKRIQQQIPSADIAKLKKFIEGNKPSLEQTKVYALKNCTFYQLMRGKIKEIYDAFI